MCGGSGCRQWVVGIFLRHSEVSLLLLYMCFFDSLITTLCSIVIVLKTFLNFSNLIRERRVFERFQNLAIPDVA